MVKTFDPHAPVSELSKAREALKAMAPAIVELGVVRESLGPDAEPGELYAAAEIARERRDVALFDDIVGCLKRIAESTTLDGIRLHTVWTLTSALHRTLVADIKHSPKPSLTKEQLLHAQSVLKRLVQHSRVLADRPDDPLKGVRGPAKWANDWITQGLAKLEPVAAG